MADEETVTSEVADTPEVTEATPAEVTTEEPVVEATSEEAQEVTSEETPAEASPVDLAGFRQEFADNGSLADESYEALEGMGFTRDDVDAYIKGASQGLSTEQADSLIAEIGGEDAYTELTKWAGENLSDEELEGYNSALTTPANAKMAVEWLQGRMQAVEGKAAAVTLEGSTAAAAAPAIQPFADRSEQSKAINDPRYKSDIAYQKKVRARIAVSDL